MNNIKFKAYIKKLNAIYDVWTMVFLDEWIRVFLKRELLDWEQLNYLIDWKDNVLMQSTWLYDKDNQPIFEGDIVNIIDWRCDKDWKKVSWFDDHNKRLRENWPIIDKAIIEYDNEYACFNINGEQTVYRTGEYWLEIIWNIYLNPELLWKH